jgi:hypothetical protein
MNGRNLVVACVVAGVAIAMGSVSASANLQWCVSDPPLQVVTPGGHNLTINNQVYLPPSALHLKNLIYDQASAEPDGQGGTLVTVHVYVPSQAHVVSSENRFRLTTSGDGSSVITLYLDVPTT